MATTATTEIFSCFGGLATVVATYNTSTLAITQVTITNNSNVTCSASLTNNKGGTFNGSQAPGTTHTYNIPNGYSFVQDTDGTLAFNVPSGTTAFSVTCE